MKNIFAYILIFLLCAPPIQAHNDIIVYEDVTEHLDVNDAHELAHHQNDTEDDKHSEHHHHCKVITMSSAITATENNFNLISFSSEEKQLNFYQVPYYTSYLERIFQPPKA